MLRMFKLYIGLDDKVLSLVEGFEIHRVWLTKYNCIINLLLTFGFSLFIIEI